MKFRTIRDPSPKIVRTMMPTIVLGLLSFSNMFVEDATTDYHNGLKSLIMCLFIFIILMKDMKNKMPDISSLTSLEYFMLLYIAICMIPLGS